ncbi:MAG: hypothetical protein IJU12_06565, partial [Clostridia bacterium]|nr:hypothetical protein [Clostridia bacterium]
RKTRQRKERTKAQLQDHEENQREDGTVNKIQTIKTAFRPKQLPKPTPVSRHASGEDARTEVLNDINATLQGLEEAERCGLFVQHQEECVAAIQSAGRILKALREAILNGGVI